MSNTLNIMAAIVLGAVIGFGLRHMITCIPFTTICMVN